MTPAARAFYNRHFLLTVLLPAYLLALLFYGSAWLLLASFGGAPAFIGVFVMLGLSRLLSGLGFLATGVPAARVAPTPNQTEKLSSLVDYGIWEVPIEELFPDPMVHEPLLAKGYDFQLIDIGPVPYLAALWQSRELWLSTYTLEHSDKETLFCMLAHERAHLQQDKGCRGCGLAWADLSWLAAYPLAWLAFAAGQPLLLLLGALIHVSLWLHLGQHARQRSERRADLVAAELLGRERYASALVRHLAQFEESDPDALVGGRSGILRISRLQGLGYSKEDAARLIAANTD